ncbi:hypothetical protein PybrP1_006177 [[Pythium] brassicae (nom. inval.)]|nr:hypothetical protein PybrP1_006177 [[Pythium] brassicae (nom. inval.)]
MASTRSTRRKIIVSKPDPDELAELQKQKEKQTALLIRQSGPVGGEKRAVPMGGTAIERSMVSPGSLAVYSIKPAVSSDPNAHNKKLSLFAVHVQNAISGRSWVVHRKYSEFVTLQTLITAHFKSFSSQFPRLHEAVSELYFPRKHKLRYKMNKIVEHRCEAFLEYLVAVHRVLISQSYLQRKDISDIGLSIFRGFIGSGLVQESAHKDYVFHKPIRPSTLKPSDRSPVHQCGALLTVLEDDAEEEEVSPVFPTTPVADKSVVADESTDETDFDGSSSCGESTDTEEADEHESVFRRHSKKYARNRRTLTFLKKELIV